MRTVNRVSDQPTIVIIEDEPTIAANVAHVLEVDGFHPRCFTTSGEGLAFIQQNDAALLILDVGLPDGNGFELCKTIREFSDIPIIFLTARNDEIDRVVGLEIGADDYVTKPFSPREVLARVKLRIKSRPRPKHIAHDPLQPKVQSQRQIQPQKHVQPQDRDDAQCSPDQAAVLHAADFDYSVDGHMLGLTAVEYKILHKLISVASNVLSREQLMIAADMRLEASYERNIDSHIKAIRHKLKPFGLSERIATKRGFGYFYTQND